MHVKRWYQEKCALLSGQGDRAAIIERMRAIGEAEIQNARNTIPLVDFDSRLGYEPSMEYMCDRAHLEWKIRETQRAMRALDEPLPAQTGSEKSIWAGGIGE